MWWVAEAPLLLIGLGLPLLYLIRGAHPLHPRRSRRFRGERVPLLIAIEKNREKLNETRRSTSSRPFRTLHKDRA